MRPVSKHSVDCVHTEGAALPPMPERKRKAINSPEFWAKPHPRFQAAKYGVNLTTLRGQSGKHLAPK
ncbi:hypothetical protein NUW54_g93 [Trametes sanguinea]|uniref:Uncharacterized protein n=1 Tax=Trametes sanguinea TaxID=158606 RepID=A0ACC1QE20_9APHY|nr:hypothetical protein NUW54_g93 [Trametes sanguinea]